MALNRFAPSVNKTSIAGLPEGIPNSVSEDK